MTVSDHRSIVAYRLDRRAVARDFEAAAADYERAAVLQRTVSERLLERLDVIRIKPKCILDLGSGSGAAAVRLAKRYRRARILQMDIALNMLKVARRRASRWFSRQSYVQADALALPLASASVDFVFSSLMLQWIEQPAQLLAELRRCLCPGGLIQLSSFGPDTLQELRDSWAVVDNDIPHVNQFMDMHDIGDALIRAGYADPVMEVEHFHLTYRDGYALMRELKQLGAQNVLAGRRRGLTGRRRLQAMLAAYERYRDTDGRLPATFEVIYGHAWVPQSGAQYRNPHTGEVHVPLGTLHRKRS